MFWFVFRRFLKTPLGIFGLIILFIIGFYAVEDWRGKRLWKKCKTDYEAQREHLDWAYFVPPEIPDEENFFKAPMMKEWFQEDTNRTYSSGSYPFIKTWPSEEKHWSELKNTEPVIHAPNGVDYPASVLTNWFEMQYADKFNLLRAACQRPKARLDGNHADAWSGPNPNFIEFRQVAQILSARAEAYFKMGRSDLALQDLTMLRRLMDCLQSSPHLVSTMIRVAIGGLYVSGVRDSLSADGWTEAQLETIQEQLRSMDFLPDLNRSFRSEVASMTSYIETEAVRDVVKALDVNGSNGGTRTFGDEIMGSLRKSAYWFIPRGWIYQNMVVYAEAMKHHCWTDFDLATRRIFPKTVASNAAVINNMDSSSGLFDQLAAMVVPNFLNGAQALARNQTAAQLAALGCSLERYKRVEKHYPENLDELVPRFIEKLPSDLITGKPPIYRRLSDEKFLLYSVGWDEVDDGGSPVPDWVWPDVAKSK